MHEKTMVWLLDAAVRGDEPLMTPVERREYDSYRKDIAAHPGMGWSVPTGYPDYGIEMRYSGTEGNGLSFAEVRDLDEKAQRIICLIEDTDLVCEDGFLTVDFHDRSEQVMSLKKGRLTLPRFGSAVPGRLEEQLCYGISAYVMENFNDREDYVMTSLEELVLRTVSVFLLRKLALFEQANVVLRTGGTRFTVDHESSCRERTGDTAADIRRIADLFRPEDLVPFLRVRDYVDPSGSAKSRSLNTKALRENYPGSKAVQALCDIRERVGRDTSDFADCMTGDPYEDHD